MPIDCAISVVTATSDRKQEVVAIGVGEIVVVLHIVRYSVTGKCQCEVTVHVCDIGAQQILHGIWIWPRMLAANPTETRV